MSQETNTEARPLHPFVNELEENYRAGSQVIILVARDIRWANALCRKLAKYAKAPLFEWSPTEGMTIKNDTLPGGVTSKLPEQPQSLSVMAALASIGDRAYYTIPSALFVFNHCANFLREVGTQNALIKYITENYYQNTGPSDSEEEAATDIAARQSEMMLRMLIWIVSPNDIIPPIIADNATIMRLPLPTEDELRDMLKSMGDNTLQPEDPNQQIGSCGDELLDLLSRRLVGLTLQEAQTCAATALVRNKGFSSDMVQHINVTKSRMVEKLAALQYIPSEHVRGFDQFGGGERLKQWVRIRRAAFTHSGREAGLPNIRGIGLLGLPGSGKSMASECLAHELNLPLVALRIGALFSSLVGSSEQKVREVFSLVDAIGDCVLFIDEIDKTLNVGEGSSNSDGGVSMRMIQEILTWTQYRKSSALLVLSMNKPTRNTPELLRRGRVDCMFFVDLPSPAVRRSVLEIHSWHPNLAEKGAKPTVEERLALVRKIYQPDEWQQLVTATDNMVPAEIESAIKDARFASYAADPQRLCIPNFDELMASIQETSSVRISLAEGDHVNQLREMGRKWGVPLDTPEKVSSGLGAPRPRVGKRQNLESNN